MYSKVFSKKILFCCKKKLFIYVFLPQSQPFSLRIIDSLRSRSKVKVKVKGQGQRSRLWSKVMIKGQTLKVKVMSQKVRPRPIGYIIGLDTQIRVL